MAETENLNQRRETTETRNEAEADEVSETDQNRQTISDREAYCNSLRMWIHQAQMYQNLSNCFPYYMMTFQGMQNNQSNVPLLNNNYQFHGQQLPVQMPPPPRPPPPPPVPQNPFRVHNQVNAGEVISRHGGYEYVIPSLYKRVAAELIDFLLVFILKLFITLIAVDVFDVIDISKFDFNKLGSNYDDYKYAIDLTAEILYFELLFKVFTCVCEGFCLSGNILRTGGATPGKSLMGLRVICATAVVQVEGRAKETVLLYPGTPLPFNTAMLRAIVKSIFISILFPICIVFFVFRFNRTGYDLMCTCIVVEENMYPPRRHAP